MLRNGAARFLELTPQATRSVALRASRAALARHVLRGHGTHIGGTSRRPGIASVGVWPFPTGGTPVVHKAGTGLCAENLFQNLFDKRMAHALILGSWRPRMPRLTDGAAGESGNKGMRPPLQIIADCGLQTAELGTRSAARGAYAPTNRQLRRFSPYILCGLCASAAKRQHAGQSVGHSPTYSCGNHEPRKSENVRNEANFGGGRAQRKILC